VTIRAGRMVTIRACLLSMGTMANRVAILA
jgi:hypothetical protein